MPLSRPRDCFTSYYAIDAVTANRPLSGREMHLQFVQYLDLAHCDCLGLATPMTPARVLGADDSRAIGKVTFTLSNAALPKPEFLVNFNGSQEELRSFTAALLLHLGPLIAWILETAPTHFAPLSNARKKEVKDAELTFYDAYGDVGTMLAQQHILEIRIRVLQDLLPPTTHSMRSWYNYGSWATTDVWDTIFATYHAESVLRLPLPLQPHSIS